jgi:phage host-nuclease inhibitor protein Gam
MQADLTEAQRLDAEPESTPVATTEFGDAVSPGWRIESIIDADWALERLRALDQEISDAEEMEQAAVARIKLRTQKLTAAAQRGKEFFYGKLREYAETHRPELVSGKKKSRALTHGTIGWKKAGGQPVKKDEAALLDWARAQPPESEFLKIEESPNWALIKAHVKKTGELVPGTDLEPEREDFYIDVTE